MNESDLANIVMAEGTKLFRAANDDRDAMGGVLLAGLVRDHIQSVEGGVGQWERAIERVGLFALDVIAAGIWDGSPKDLVSILLDRIDVFVGGLPNAWDSDTRTLVSGVMGAAAFCFVTTILQDILSDGEALSLIMRES